LPQAATLDDLTEQFGIRFFAAWTPRVQVILPSLSVGRNHSHIGINDHEFGVN
jgi:hypothetical protein